jgi:Right handed beta helix region
MRKQQLLTVLALAGWAVACSSSVVRALEITNPNPNKRFFYTLTQNLTETVWIQSDNVYLNCNGHSVTNPKPEVKYYGTGIAVLNARYVTIAHCHVSGWFTGIGIERSPDSLVLSNELFDNGFGLDIVDHSAPISVLYNRIRDNLSYGLELRTSLGEIGIMGNTFLYNGLWRTGIPNYHLSVRSCCVTTLPLEQFGNSFTPPLPLD